MSVQFSSVQKCDLDDASIWHLNNSKSQEQRTGSVWNWVVLGSRFVLLFCVAITMFLKLGKLIMVTKLGLGHHGFWYLAPLWKYTPMPISTVCMIRLLLFFLMNPFLTISFRLFPVPVKKGGAQNKDRHTRCEQCTEVRGLCACFYAWIWHCRCCRPAASWWPLCGFLWDQGCENPSRWAPVARYRPPIRERGQDQICHRELHQDPNRYCWYKDPYTWILC